MRVYELECGHLLIPTPDKTGLTDGDQTFAIQKFDFTTMKADIENDPSDLWSFRELSVREKVNEIDRILAIRNCMLENYNHRNK